MNYIQTLHFLNDKLSYYKSRLEMMKKSDRTFSQRDWDITINKIDKKKTDLSGIVNKIDQKLNNKKFIERAPSDIINQNISNRAKIENDILSLRSLRNTLSD